MQSSCAHYVPQCTVQVLRARGKRAVVLPLAFGLPSIVAGWTLSATSTASAVWASTATTTLHSPAHRRLRQALRIQRCTARPLFTRPAWPRRALRSHHHQRTPLYCPCYSTGWAWYANSTAFAAAAASTATTTMRSPAAFHTAGVAVEKATLARRIT